MCSGVKSKRGHCEDKKGIGWAAGNKKRKTQYATAGN